MLLARTLLFVAYVFIKVCYGEWVEISQTLPKPNTEPVTQPTVLQKLSTTSTTQYLTFATTELSTPEIVYNNVSLRNKFSKRKSEHSFSSDGYEINTDPTNFGFMSHIEDIQKNLMKNNHKTLKNKVDILKELKENLLYNIKDKINNIWNSKDKSREARGYNDEEYHMDFPSNEGALMTIGFLTFAVFLIKLVLKLITALKQKQNGTLTTTVAPTFLIGRKKRDIDEEAIKILKLIDEFNFKQL